MEKDNYITLLTASSFSYPSEIYVVRAMLESEGIECFLKDELTAQVNHFYSPAIGGVKLQVYESDLEKAKQLLIENGYFKEQEIRPETPGKLDNFTAKLPLVKHLPPILRTLIL